MNPQALGEQIRQARTQAGVGLRELGRRAEMSAAALSAVEKGQSSPTLATLHKILKALGTDFARFFAAAEQADAAPVYPAAEMRSIEDACRRYTFLLPRDEGMRFSMVRETIDPGEAEPEWEIHDCDLGGVILDGGPARLEIEGQGQWALRRGDAFYVKAGLRHRAVNLGKRPLRQITVMDPPRY